MPPKNHDVEKYKITIMLNNDKNDGFLIASMEAEPLIAPKKSRNSPV